MSHTPLVSCIIIFFNAEKFFEEAIESVLAQTYENWELLLADDGSMDNSTAIALRYAQQYPGKVHYLEHDGHQNCGMSATRNLGIRHANGKYITFLDSDDVWLPHKLERQVTIMESHPDASMLYGASLYWYSWTGEPDDRQRDQVIGAHVPLNTLIQPPTLLTSCIFVPEHKAGTPCPSNICLRRDAVERIGGFQERFTDIYQMFEDQAFFTKLYLHEPVLAVNECWDKYRIHPDSCCSIVTQTGKYQAARSFFLSWAEKYLLEQKESIDPSVWRALQKTIWLHQHPFWDALLREFENTVVHITRLFREIVKRILPVGVYQWLKSNLKGAKALPQTDGGLYVER